MSKKDYNGTRVISVCVFCSSSDHIADKYKDVALKLGIEIAERGMTLIYGGGNNGLMGVLSENVHEHGGRIIGVITGEFKKLGYAYKDADEMICVDSIRERQAVMEEHSDCFIGMAGGFGTLEEILEMITFKQLGLHDKPVVFLNTDAFFSGLLEQLETCYRNNFIPGECRDLYYVTDSVHDALDYVEQYCSVK
ncbi:TIGR00730 family Rossman fold protein [Candidatus Latescibacterota bacterium]